MHGEHDEVIRSFYQKILREENIWKTKVRIEGYYKNREMSWEDVNWIYLAQNMVFWPVVVDVIISHCVT
jgi:hypothetical protein